MTETTQKNIYQKLQDARVQLGNMSIKKSGEVKNKEKTFTLYTYYELQDFLPAINKLGLDLGFSTYFKITTFEGAGVPELATLFIVDSDNPESKIEFSSRTAEVSIINGGAIQNLGAKHTYMRRYLLIEAFEISENDSVEVQEQKEAVDQLDDMTIDQINSAQTHDELIAICKELKDKFPKQRDNIVLYFTKRRNEINQENALKLKGDKPSENI